MKASGSMSDLGIQIRGVRQGCRLFPYLLVLICPFEDFEEAYAEPFVILAGVLLVPSRLWDLESADVTALVSHSYVQLDRPLHLLQFQIEYPV